MSVLSVSLNATLATAGISVANPSQLTAIRDTVAGSTAAAPQQQGGAQATGERTGTGAGTGATKGQLSPAEQRRVDQLERIDTEVRAHEQAHITVGRDLITSAPSYDYVYGPDGKRYAVAGEVGIDTSPEQKPQANIDKGQHIQATALAPQDPSPQDYRVAATGKALEQRGREELSTQQSAATETDAGTASRGVRAYAAAANAGGGSSGSEPGSAGNTGVAAATSVLDLYA